MEMVMSMSSMSLSAARDPVAQTPPECCGTALKRWWSAYLLWRMEAAAIDRLRSMSDRDLKDIGLTRAAIVPAVRQSWH
jgi:uncharacterized protein YjiS (DUF1127 family)